ncbi:DUF4097 family beta strand repeat-containing protein [Pseudonocardia sp. N23]|uniref:DUF4097 family beta strand repeat-containing protein n=1 Tax=Pseudonocardia sp. N23 TaxID=1987376 RepID=UPI000BFBD5FC|nr:DUF4097 family beta strand repeat-containing protein [Pseudonocardia sp. N23]GAY12949.1 hypothetical protein TOK_1502 [Pseudonocardia sp. N23]
MTDHVFDTPGPVRVTIDLPNGNVRVVASARADTRVTVSPADPDADTTTQVSLLDGELAIKGAPQRRFGWALDWLRGSTAENVEIELPAGSRIDATLAMGEYRCDGPLGECRLATRYGDIRVDEAGPLRLETTYGEIHVEHARGDAEIMTGAGDIQVRTLDGPATVKNDYGGTRIEHAGGDLQVTGLYGDVRITRAEGGVNARTAYGGVRIDDVARGVVDLTTTSGVLEVGIRAGTAAWLDVSSASGRVRNSLTSHDNPDGFTDTVEVHAHTDSGDIVVRRA